MIVTCVQMEPAVGEAARRSACLDAIDAGRQTGAHIIILPELSSSGYVFSSHREAQALAIRPDDPLLSEWAAALTGTHAVVVGGFAEADPGGALFNSAAVIDSSGVLAVYRKTHLWDTEKLYFSPGDGLPPVIDLPFARLGVLICYDLEFPEMPRQLALAGAQVLAVPTSWPLLDRPAGERPPEVLVAMGTARVNKVSIACADRCGTERGLAWAGGTTIVDEGGWVAASTEEAGLVSAELEPARASDKRISERNDLFADRRVDLYHGVLAPTPAATWNRFTNQTPGG